MEYVVLIGDIIRSRKVGERTRLMDALLMTVDRLNVFFGPIILSPFRVVRGDQFQGLVSSLALTPKMIVYLKSELYPWKVRVSVGRGTVSTGIMSDISLMDGEAFLRAAEGLEQARRRRREVIYRVGSAEIERVTGMVFAVAEVLWRRWNEALWRRCVSLMNHKPMKEIAEEEGISYQAVHKSLKRMGVLALKEALEGLEAWLREKGDGS